MYAYSPIDLGRIVARQQTRRKPWIEPKISSPNVTHFRLSPDLPCDDRVTGSPLRRSDMHRLYRELSFRFFGICTDVNRTNDKPIVHQHFLIIIVARIPVRVLESQQLTLFVLDDNYLKKNLDFSRMQSRCPINSRPRSVFRCFARPWKKTESRFAVDRRLLNRGRRCSIRDCLSCSLATIRSFPRHFPLHPPLF